MLAVPTLVQVDAVPNLSILYKSMEQLHDDAAQNYSHRLQQKMMRLQIRLLSLGL
jgi:hypothetical protein